MKNKEIKFETLKKSHKKHIIVGVVAVCIIGSALTFKLTHSKYRVTQSIDLGSGVINYKVPDFKIMAMYQQSGTDYVEIDKTPGVNYKINTSKSYCTLDNVNHDSNAKIYTNKYGQHVFENLSKNDKCYVWFDKNTKTVSTILGNIEVNNSIPDFSKTATTDEGIFQTSDGMYGGTTYYWRGAATNNYVKFAGYCWRIIRINGDGSIRLIYDGSTCHANGTNTTESIAVANTKYNSNGISNVGWTYSSSQRPSTNVPQASGTDSNAKTQLENWYSSNIDSSYKEKIADGKYCNDRNVKSGYTWESGSDFDYVGKKRYEVDQQPALSCPDGDIYALKVGLITVDEAAFAGFSKGYSNGSNYLCNGQNYWTMSPSKYFSGISYVFTIAKFGSLGETYIYYTYHGIRPVINLKSDVTFSSGDGTISKPYIVS